MKPKPILFSRPMVRALFDGRKTQTRRLIKPQPPAEAVSPALILHSAERPKAVGKWEFYGGKPQRPVCDPIAVRFDRRDVLYVRESHRLTDCECTEACRGPGHVYYEADASGYRNVAHNRLRPGIHMPRWASRLTLDVTDVRVWHLQDITEEDAKAEGLIKLKASGRYVFAEGAQYAGMADISARRAYSYLWDAINGAGSWDANPWVVAVTFTVHKCNVDELLKQREAA